MCVCVCVYIYMELDLKVSFGVLFLKSKKKYINVCSLSGGNKV